MAKRNEEGLVRTLDKNRERGVKGMFRKKKV